MTIKETSLSMTQYPGQLSWKQFSKAFLDASANGIVVTDRSLKTTISNRHAQGHLEVFTGTLIESTLPELAEISRAVLKNQISERDIEIVRHNKKFLTRISPILWGEFKIGLLYLFEDITRLEKISKKLRSYQEISIELDTIINSSHDGFWISDGQGKVVKINSASEHLSGIRADNVVGKNIQELLDNGTIDQSVTLKVLATKKKETIIQHTKTGKKLLLTGTPVFDKEGKLFRIVVNERDITEIENLKKEIDEKQALKAAVEGDLLEMQLEALKSKNIIAKSLNFKTVLQKAIKIGRADSSVLILGESGTGKGVIAEMIHYHSKRRDKPMIKLNCSTIPEPLLESELFGYKKGAFTGATRNKAGRFEIADKGILFLDEIGELPLASQVKLLRFLEDGHLSRVGETTSKKIDVRIIAATNQDLKAMVANKTFRQDLYYRLKVIPIHLPPLRERKDCILPLVLHYINYFSQKHSVEGSISLSSNAAQIFENYDYPGNVRELKNIIERAVIMCDGDTIMLDHISLSGDIGMSEPNTSDVGKDSDTLDLEFHEKELIKKALLRTGNNKSKAAVLLNVTWQALDRRLKKFGLD